MNTNHYTKVGADQDVWPITIKKQGYMFVGGTYNDKNNDKVMSGQMYVQYMIPEDSGDTLEGRLTKYPIIMIHGAFQTGTNFLGTPDGRPGWADYFVKQGWPVYVVDMPGRGKSGYFETYGPPSPFPLVPSANFFQALFTAGALNPLVPQASLHTQWPGKGTVGDEIFDQFFASQVLIMDSNTMQYDLTTKATTELLDKIGPAIILTHSQSGPLSWMIAQANPDKVKAIIAIEPLGPTPPPPPAPPLKWALTETPLPYIPEVTDPSEFGLYQAESEGEGLTECWLQAEPAHKLPWLNGIPIAIVVAEASYKAPITHCTSRFLTQAGVKNELLRLEEFDIHGNGHMMMLEKNNLEIAKVLENWLQNNLTQ